MPGGCDLSGPTDSGSDEDDALDAMLRAAAAAGASTTDQGDNTVDATVDDVDGARRDPPTPRPSPAAAVATSLDSGAGGDGCLGVTAEEELCRMFGNLVQGGLIRSSDLVQGGFTEAARTAMTRDRDATWRRGGGGGRDRRCRADRGSDADGDTDGDDSDDCAAAAAHPA
eukprot:CAMPEP_0174871800 /NCGR_PEP_ID=MMETSP1114-20130205/72150_1 /TAXON_ID=312471 /ORGANISM="Neobodo designis, Strain CCAP 1951/1" /LENGTH=169 /DNA_ID=CAMNT_0016107091 /DNA_START=35 /DNA_END=540 /DNA_ORIENTATION=-